MLVQALAAFGRAVTALDETELNAAFMAAEAAQERLKDDRPHLATLYHREAYILAVEGHQRRAAAEAVGKAVPESLRAITAKADPETGGH